MFACGCTADRMKMSCESSKTDPPAPPKMRPDAARWEVPHIRYSPLEFFMFRMNSLDGLAELVIGMWLGFLLSYLVMS